jgi:hypothetical protein
VTFPPPPTSSFTPPPPHSLSSSRRQLAMKRLLERKEKQVARQEVAKRKKLLRQSEQSKGVPKKSEGDRVMTSPKTDDQDLVSVQAVYQSDSESEESLSGDDREENVTEISEVAIHNIIVEDPIIDQHQEQKQKQEEQEQEEQEEQNVNISVVEENHKSPEDPEEMIDSKPPIQHDSLSPQIELDHPTNDQSNSRMMSQEIDKDKSSAALSTLRKLKFKKVRNLPITSSLDSFIPSLNISINFIPDDLKST